MHHEEIEQNFDASCQQILGLESEILWEARSTPTLPLVHFQRTTQRARVLKSYTNYYRILRRLVAHNMLREIQKLTF
jgi:hypothetical protein